MNHSRKNLGRTITLLASASNWALFQPSPVIVCFALLVQACAGGSPLLHTARALSPGDVRFASGLSGTLPVGPYSKRVADIDKTRNELLAASVAPGVAPFIAGRAGIRSGYEGGISYTGRGARIDIRRSTELKPVTLSAGVGVSGIFFGRDSTLGSGNSSAEISASRISGYGADVPILIGWESDGGLYAIWGGARAGWDHVSVGSLTSQAITLPVDLVADRVWGGGLLGVSAGFGHIHAALELNASIQSVWGHSNGARGVLSGVSVTPSSALWWTF